MNPGGLALETFLNAEGARRRAYEERYSVTASVAQSRRVLMSPEQIDRMIARLAHQILEPEDAQQACVLLGIRRGGEALVRRIAARIEEISGAMPPVGFLNVSLYRDDDVSRTLPDSEIHEAVSGKLVVLVDDVLYTGRTVRAALDAVTDLGRPRAIRLAVLIDRGLRELPIQADYVGRFVPTNRRERVIVKVAKSLSPDDEVALSFSGEE
jgi:pyrimidine operon attenuation protein/uracil phosphoribosyltransferase